MAMRELEAGILREAREITGNKKLRQKDILEWTTGDCKVVEGEKIYRLPKIGVNIAIKK